MTSKSRDTGVVGVFSSGPRVEVHTHGGLGGARRLGDDSDTVGQLRDSGLGLGSG